MIKAFGEIMYRSSIFLLTRSVVLAYLVSAAAVFLLSWGLYVMKWEAAGSETAIRSVYFLSCFAGGFLSGKEFRERRLLWGLLTGLLYGSILLTVSQLTGGLGSSGIWEIVIVFLICLGGSAVGSIVS